MPVEKLICPTPVLFILNSSVTRNPSSIHRYFHIHAGISEVDTEQKISSTMKTKLMLAREEQKEIRNVYTIDYVRLHPDYDDETLTSDICLIRVHQTFTFSELIQPIKLPASDFIMPIGETVQVIGWGLSEVIRFSVDEYLQLMICCNCR